jgi:Kef-type K+ transport system membrane component KefB
MKKRLSFLPATMVGLMVMFVLGMLSVWILGKFNLPDWVAPLLGGFSMLLFFETVGRVGPQEIDTPTIRFLKLSRRDRVVTVVATLALLVLLFPIGMRFESRWLSLLFMGLGFLAFWSICFFFGSKELMQRTPKE